MPDLVLSEDQSAMLEGAGDPIVVRDASGRKEGELRVPGESSTDERIPVSADELEEIQRRMASDGPWATTEQVLQRLKTLETKCADSQSAGTNTQR